MSYTCDETLLNTLETESNKADSVLTVIQQHYFDCMAEHVKENPIALVWEYKTYSDLLDVGLDLIRNAKEISTTAHQKVEGGAIND